MTTNIHNGDIGTIFRLTIVDSSGTAIDVSSASVKKIYFQDPSGNKSVEDASFYTDGSDGIIQYTAVSGDIDETGNWQIQGYVETTDGKFFSEKESFAVLSTLYTT